MNDRTDHHTSAWTTDAALPTFRDVRERRLVPERMDDPDIDPELHVQALKGIRRINAMSASASAIWPTLRGLAATKPIRVLDLACGSGDVAIALARKAQRAGLPMVIEGCDISPTAVQFATDTAKRKRIDARFFAFDVLHDELPQGYDVIYSSLFIHHLATPQVQQLLTRMAAVAPTIIINDLIRCRIGLVLAYVACNALSLSPIVHFDGPCSVAAAFTIPEIRHVAQDAGLNQASVSWKWPYRYLLTYSKANGA